MGIPVVTRTAEDFAAAQLGALPGGLLSDAETRRILEDLYLAIGDVQILYVDPLLAGMESTLDPETCPDVCLDGLLSLVGVSSAVAWVRGLTETELRTLALLAPALWRTKGLPDGARALYRFLAAGNDLMSWDWPWWRYEVGDEIGGVALTDVAAGGAWERTLHLSDPRTDVNRTLVADAVDFTRAGPEKVTLLWCLLAEPFLQGLSRWTVTGAPVWTAGQVALASGDALSQTETWETGRVLASIQRAAGAGYLEVGMAVVDASNLWRVRVYEDRIDIDLVRAGVATTVATGVCLCAASVWYLLDLRLDVLASGGVEASARLDGNVICSGTVM